MNSSPMPDLWKKQQVCDVFKISIGTLNRLVKSRELKFIKIGRAVRFDPADVREFIIRRKCRRAPLSVHHLIRAEHNAGRL